MVSRIFYRWSGRAVATLLLIAAQAALAVPDTQFDAAFELFTQARAGDSSAIEPAADSFTSLLRAEPINPVVMAYAGAATAMRARTTWFPWKKMGFAEDGMALLDKSLAMLTSAHSAPLQHNVPAALEVRFVAANTFLAVPGFMNRGPRGAKLLQAVVDSPLLAASPLSFRENVWMVAAKEAIKDKRPEDARKYLNEVIQANGPQQQAARAQLQALSS
ncbi:hypothetical protein [Rhodoferax sp.]|uniref:hypothetical protein n=1 Tax=Rhodoferax sp. TaxID=50421 RepID=UPI0028419BC5|nr:hypothetical protein [Rhodoferax sp.]MDR3367632.1 hypothetical protein [Rhodoferax sp.]